MINDNDNDYKSMDRSAYEVGPATPAKSLIIDWLIGRKALGLPRGGKLTLTLFTVLVVTPDPLFVFSVPIKGIPDHSNKMSIMKDEERYLYLGTNDKYR